jgi:hypothetical protein
MDELSHMLIGKAGLGNPASQVETDGASRGLKVHVWDHLPKVESEKGLYRGSNHLETKSNLKNHLDLSKNNFRGE